VLGDRGDLRNTLLVRAPIGLTKAGYHRLPPRTAPAFGVAPRKDAVTVNALMHGEFARDAERGLDAFERKNFPADAARARVNPFAPAATRSAAAVFGASSASRTPAADLINYKFAVEGLPGTEHAPERSYAPAEGARPPGRLPRPRHTRSSHALRETSLFRLAHGPTAEEADRLPSLAYSKRLSAALGEDRFGSFTPRPTHIHL